MHIALVIFMASLTTVSAQGCTGFHRICVSGASCDSDTEKCVCPPGTYGDGLLDCVPNGMDNCYICADPKIIQFPGSKGELVLPCRKSLAKFFVPIVDSDKLCRFTIYGISVLVSIGRLFEGEVEIELAIGSQQPAPNQTVTSFEAEDTIYFRINQGGYRWTTDPNGFKANDLVWIKKFLNESASVVFAEVNITITPDSDNILTWEVLECDTRVKFRPYDVEEAPQTRLPGVSITTPPRAEFNDRQCQFPNVLCATPSDNEGDLQRAANSHGLTVDQYLLFVSLRNAPKQTRGAFKVECSNLRVLFTSTSSCNRTTLIKAVRTCSSLLAKRTMLECLQAVGTYYNAVELFHRCTKFVCLGKSICNSVLTFINKCPKAPAFAKMNCIGVRGNNVVPPIV